MRKFMIPAVAMLLLLAGCSSGAEVEAAPTPTPTPTKTSTPDRKMPTPTTTPEPQPINFTIKCHKENYRGTKSFAHYSDAWNYGGVLESCAASTKSGTITTEAMQAALDYWAKGDNSSDPLGYIFEECAEIGIGKYNDYTQVTGTVPYHVGAALILCPDVPNGEHAASLVEAAETDQELIDSGQMFYTGSHLVGEDIQPGHYYTETTREGGFDGCYWERLDSAGNIIDNNFISGGFRAEVYIDASDYSFSSDGCAGWRPLN